VSRENTRARTTDLYLIDELYDLFAPHIDEVMRNPVDYNTEKSLKTPLDAVIFEGQWGQVSVPRWHEGTSRAA